MKGEPICPAPLVERKSLKKCSLVFLHQKDQTHPLHVVLQVGLQDLLEGNSYQWFTGFLWFIGVFKKKAPVPFDTGAFAI